VTLLNMTQNLADQPWFLDASDDAQLAAAIRAAFDIDVEYPFQSLRPPGLDPGSSVPGVCLDQLDVAGAVARSCGGA
jgi:hypothetical protein